MRPGPWIRLLVAFGVGSLIALSYEFSWTREPHALLCRWIASIASASLDLLGLPSFLDVASVYTLGYSVRIVPDCTGLLPALVLTTAVLLGPWPLRRRVLLSFAALLLVFVLNQLRILTILAVGMRSHELASLLHEAVFPAAYLFLFALFCFLWLSRMRQATESRDLGARRSQTARP